ncbi:RDD family protein [Marinifilum caeruleilacunae]|uniref:RDD family protein n=1 Tax=Marinifilum caeruleilacunae TaxID=2499076 RepID=A0ABX1WVV6_9BACT|nr:RDD family protein [Marinifilum caeruleilacunae]NOU60250.1 RDD family protein [Marinifilum caeruleilacunae]
MTNEFSDVMSERSNEELIKITTELRLDYQPEAVVAAEKELAKREVSADEVEATKEVIREKKIENEELDGLKVKSWVRFVHMIVDWIVIFFTYIVLFALFGGIMLENSDPKLFEAVMPFTLLLYAFLYYIILESKTQKTLGKMLMKTKVVKMDGTVPEVADIIARTFCRLIPFDRISYLFTKNGFHDRLSSTMVVKDLEE